MSEELLQTNINDTAQETPLMINTEENIFGNEKKEEENEEDDKIGSPKSKKSKSRSKSKNKKKKKNQKVKSQYHLLKQHQISQKKNLFQ